MRMKAKLTCLLLMLAAATAGAAQTGDSLTYNFTGTFLITTPCTVNNDQPLDVSFGNVGVNRVDGVAYSKTVPYKVDCHGAADNTAAVLTITGTQTGWDNAAVITTAAGLGIELQLNGKPLPLNQQYNTTLGALPSLTLTAVPVKDPAATLTAETFTATATLLTDMQ
ncbi:fimbrial protein [Enterobacteriaceae bacterium 89]|nr:fimbrial protein [Enterobacteriaceae bacterium 89]